MYFLAAAYRRCCTQSASHFLLGFGDGDGDPSAGTGDSHLAAHP
jgi:hypothetical protein